MNDTPQDGEVLQQIEREVRMREGASKLLAACSQKDQALEASKSLLTCNARILALLSQLQKIRKAHILERAGLRSAEDAAPCSGKVALSDLRIPLMWKDSEYFKNKGELHRCAVFCLLRCDSEIHDTDIVMVDRTLTDICFEDPVIFNKVGPEFQLRVELYSNCVVEDASPAVLAIKRSSFLGGSLGYSSGKKIRAAFESAAACGSVGGDGKPGCSSPLELSAVGPKYNLLAHTTLTIENVLNGFKTHDLTILTTEDSPFWLPLYGNLCCRLVAQPLCMTRPVISGPLTVKLKDSNIWENVHADLRERALRCYQTQEDLECGNNLMLLIPIRKDSCIRESEGHIYINAQPQRNNASFAISAHSPEDTQRWLVALQQHVYNQEQWKQSCDELMTIEAPKSRKPSALQQGSLFHEIAYSPSYLQPNTTGALLEQSSSFEPDASSDVENYDEHKSIYLHMDESEAERSRAGSLLTAVTPSSPRKGPVDPDLSNEIRTLLSSYYKESP